MRNLIAISLIICSVSLSASAVEEDTCPYLPEFKKLRAKLGTLQPAEVVHALEQYWKRGDQRETCEMFEIDALLDEQEKSFFFLQVGTTQLPAQVIMRCNEYESKTTTCQSPVEDKTLHNDPPLPSLAVPATKFSVVSNFPSAQLVGIYRRFYNDVLDGNPATRLKPKQGLVSLPKDAKHFVLIAVYKTSGPWSYRKVVWYF
jgi:hypothetical protein